MVTPNFSSAMAGFGLLYSGYFVIAPLEVWFVYRREIIETARRSRGLKRAFYAALALGTYDTSPEALEIDHRAVKVLSAIGLPAACMLHGYVGFIFGGIKANPWWSTPLMPVIFLLSAAVSGIALLVMLHQVTARLWRRPVERETVQAHGALALVLPHPHRDARAARDHAPRLRELRRRGTSSRSSSPPGSSSPSSPSR